MVEVKLVTISVWFAKNKELCISNLGKTPKVFTMNLHQLCLMYIFVNKEGNIFAKCSKNWVGHSKNKMFLSFYALFFFLSVFLHTQNGKTINHCCARKQRTP